MSGHGQHVQRTEDDFGRALAHACIVQCVAHGPLQTTQEGDGGGGVRLGPVRQHDVGVRREHRHLGIPGSGVLHTSQCNTRLTGIIHHPRRLFMAPHLQRARSAYKDTRIRLFHQTVQLTHFLSFLSSSSSGVVATVVFIIIIFTITEHFSKQWTGKQHSSLPAVC